MLKPETKIRLDELCLQLIVMASTLMLVLSAFFEVETIKYCIYAIVAFAFVLVLRIKFMPIQVFAFVCFLISAIVALLLHGGNTGSLIVSIASFFFAIFLSQNGISLSTWSFIKACTYIVSLSFVLQLIFAPKMTAYDQLVLSFDNPNMAGIAIAGPAFILVVMLFEAKSKCAKAINLALLAALFYMIYATQNRGSLIALIILLITALLASFKKKPKRLHSPRLFTLLKLTPILVMVLYIIMFQIIPKDIEVLGKPLFSGREEAWLSALKSLLSNPFAHHRFEDGTLNLFLEGAARYGTLSMFGYFLILISFNKTKEELQSMNTMNYIAFAGFHFCLIQQSFESTLLTGSYTVHIWSYLLLGIASMKPIKPNEKENTAA